MPAYSSRQRSIVMHMNQQGYEFHFPVQRRLNILDYFCDAVKKRRREFALNNKTKLLFPKKKVFFYFSKFVFVLFFTLREHKTYLRQKWPLLLRSRRSTLELA